VYLGINGDGDNVKLPAGDLTTHGVILGRTGSGKTGLTIALLEEVANSGASAIVFDPKGDLTNLALSLSDPEDFEKWVEPGTDADAARAAHAEGLRKSGLSIDSVAHWRNKVDVTIYAPGKTYGGGKSLNVFPTFDVPSGDAVPFRDRAGREVGAVLEAIGSSGDPYDPALVFLSEAVLGSWKNHQPLPVDAWPGILTDPPESLKFFGGMGVDDFFPKRKRTALARKLIGFRHQADRWLNGEQLDLHAMTERSRPEIAVFTMRHLNEEERHFFTGLMMNRLVDFMFETQASQDLKLLVVLDEARGYLPPYPHNPPTKAPICTVLAQGRAMGIGMLIGTQNPMDLDYKALSNVGTWFVGRLRERDCNRDLASELKGRGVEVEEVVDMPQRRFLLLDKRGGHNMLKVRWTLNHLRGPLGANDLLALGPDWWSKPKIKLEPVIRRPPVDDPATRGTRRAFWGKIFGGP